MKKVEYPKWKYAENAALIVANAEDERALGDGWFDSPAEVKSVCSPAVPDEKVTKDVDETQEGAEIHGEDIADTEAEITQDLEKPKRGRKGRTDKA